MIKTLLDKKAEYSLPLIEIEKINHDTKRLRFRLPSDQHVLGVPIGQHIVLTTKINNKQVISRYTPVTSDDIQGYVDLVNKIVKRDVNPNFPKDDDDDDEIMSQYLDNMKIGDTINFRGPLGKHQYIGNGTFQTRRIRTESTIVAKKLNMIATGTGIIEMVQLIREILKRPEDPTVCSLIYAERTINDILLRDELESLAAKYPNKFKLWYTLEKPAEDWTYGKRHINEEMVKNNLYPPSDDTLVLLSGAESLFTSFMMTCRNFDYNYNQYFICF